MSHQPVNTSNSPLFEQFNVSTDIPSSDFIIEDASLIFTVILAFVGNLVIICVNVTYKSLRNQDAADAVYLILFLAIADGLTGLGSIIGACCRIVRNQIFGTPPTRGFCLACIIINTFGTFFGQLMLITIAIDRLVAIVDPVRYQTKDHFKYACTSSSLCATLSLISTILQFTGDLNKVSLRCTSGSTYDRWYLLYWVIFQASMGIAVNALYIALVVIVHWKTKQNIKNKLFESIYIEQLERHANVTRAVSKILLIYTLCWVLPICLALISAVALLFFGFGPDARRLVAPSVALGLNISAGTNIFIYSFKIPSMKVYIKKFFKVNGNNNPTSVRPFRP